jgi:hypothetical protein
MGRLRDKWLGDNPERRDAKIREGQIGQPKEYSQEYRDEASKRKFVTDVTDYKTAKKIIDAVDYTTKKKGDTWDDNASTRASKREADPLFKDVGIKDFDPRDFDLGASVTGAFEGVNDAMLNIPERAIKEVLPGDVIESIREGQDKASKRSPKSYYAGYIPAVGVSSFLLPAATGIAKLGTAAKVGIGAVEGAIGAGTFKFNDNIIENKPKSEGVLESLAFGSIFGAGAAGIGTAVANKLQRARPSNTTPLTDDIRPSSLTDDTYVADDITPSSLTDDITPSSVRDTTPSSLTDDITPPRVGDTEPKFSVFPNREMDGTRTIGLETPTGPEVAVNQYIRDTDLNGNIVTEPRTVNDVLTAGSIPTKSIERALSNENLQPVLRAYEDETFSAAISTVDDAVDALVLSGYIRSNKAVGDGAEETAKRNIKVANTYVTAAADFIEKSDPYTADYIRKFAIGFNDYADIHINRMQSNLTKMKQNFISRQKPGKDGSITQPREIGMTDETTNQVRSEYKKLDEAYNSIFKSNEDGSTSYNIDALTEISRIKQEINKLMLKNVPTTIADYLGAFSYTNLLASVPTQLRNIYSNVVVNPYMAVKNVKGSIKELGSNFKNVFKGDVQPIGLSSYPEPFTINTKRPFEGGKTAKLFKEGIEVAMDPGLSKMGANDVGKITTNAMTLGDRMFKKPWIEYEMERLPNTINDATKMDIATQRVEHRLFQNDTKLGEFFQWVKVGANNVGISNPYTGASFGLGDAIVKFSRTPAAITMRMLSMNPGSAALGLIRHYKANGLDDVVAKEKAYMDVFRNYTDGLTGIGLMATGYLAYEDGTFNGGYSDDPKVRSKQYEEGYIPYSFRVGDTQVSVADAVGVAAYPVIVGYEIAKAMKDGLDKVPGGLMRVGELTALAQFQNNISGERGIVSNPQGIVENALNLVTSALSQLVPYSNQVRKLIEPTMQDERSNSGLINRGLNMSVYGKPFSDLKESMTGYPIPNSQYMDPLSIASPIRYQEQQTIDPFYLPPADTKYRTNSRDEKYGYDLTPEQYNFLKQNAYDRTVELSLGGEREIPSDIRSKINEEAWKKTIAEFNLQPTKVEDE